MRRTNVRRAVKTEIEKEIYLLKSFNPVQRKRASSKPALILYYFFFGYTKIYRRKFVLSPSEALPRREDFEEKFSFLGVRRTNVRRAVKTEIEKEIFFYKVHQIL